MCDMLIQEYTGVSYSASANMDNTRRNFHNCTIHYDGAHDDLTH